MTQVDPFDAAAAGTSEVLPVDRRASLDCAIPSLPTSPQPYSPSRRDDDGHKDFVEEG